MYLYKRLEPLRFFKTAELRGGPWSTTRTPKVAEVFLLQFGGPQMLLFFIMTSPEGGAMMDEIRTT
jgi:hypothetical protein